MKNIYIYVSAFMITMLFSYSPASEFTFPRVFAGALSSFVRPPAANVLKDAAGSRDFKIPDGEDELLSVEFPIPLAESPKLVVLDPGHGGRETGAVDNGLVEKDLTLDVALKAGSILKSSEIPVYMTRTDDSTLDYKERILTANRMHAAIYISIHFDWYKDPSLSGISTLYSPSSDLAAGSLTEKGYAEIIHKELAGSLGLKNRGLIQRTDLSVLNNASMPSVLVELGFLSNKKEARLILSDEFRQKAAEAIARGIIKALDEID